MTYALPWSILLVVLYFGKLEAVTFLDAQCQPRFSPMMINGKNANRAPWMAYLIHNGQYICGGSLVNSRKKLFNNCILSNQVKLIDFSYARLGEYDTSTTTDGDTYDIMVIAVFPGPGGQDIALLKLAGKIYNYTATIRPICIVIFQSQAEERELYSVNNFTVTGWGLISRNNNSKATILQEISVSRINSSICGNPVGQICCENHSQFICYGDSGSPLTSTHKYNAITSTVQYGVLSFGHENCYDYAKYVDIVPYTRWIAYITNLVEVYSRI
ncbi:hypothetical protein KR038_008576 [Drosophila bunnanda]|nr:hypothetical protein KR038_008576 [Drosophila bunnanda]